MRTMKEDKKYNGMVTWDANTVFVEKDQAKQLVTGPVAVPNCPDCDAEDGEKLLSVDEIEDMAHYYNTKSRMSDAMHLYDKDGRVIGETVENWTLKEETKTENINGKTVTLPVGTWMATVKVTDKDTWKRIERGELRGFSAMYVPRKVADSILASKRTLIRDLDDPVPLVVSIVDKPCVHDAIFTSVKDSGGFSESTVNRLNRLYSVVSASFDEVKQLVSLAENERIMNLFKSDKSILEELNMDMEELEKLISETVIKAVDERFEALKTEEEPEEEEQEPESKPEEEQEPEVEMVTKEEFDKIKQELDTIKAKIGKREGNSLKGQEDTKPPKPVVKSFEEELGRDMYGCKLQK